MGPWPHHRRAGATVGRERSGLNEDGPGRDARNRRRAGEPVNRPTLDTPAAPVRETIARGRECPMLWSPVGSCRAWLLVGPSGTESSYTTPGDTTSAATAAGFRSRIGLHHVRHLHSSIIHSRLQEYLDASPELLAILHKLHFSKASNVSPLPCGTRLARKPMSFSESRSRRG